MAATSIVQARLEPEIKEEATRILAAIGMTPSQAVRLLFARVVAEKSFPMELLVPNETTLAAMAEAESGSLRTAATIEALFTDLHADN